MVGLPSKVNASNFLVECLLDALAQFKLVTAVNAAELLITADTTTNFDGSSE